MNLESLVKETLARRANKLARLAPLDISTPPADKAAAPSAETNSTRSDAERRDWEAMPLAKLENRINRAVGKAIGDFKLIEEGDRILVAISGGKDSWALLHILNEMRKRAPVRYEIIAVNIDQGYADFRQDIVEDFVASRGYDYHMEYFNIAKIIEEKTAPGSTPCAMCSRLRRGALYGYAEKYNCNKIALGHHLDDFIETTILNMFFVGRTASMAPKLLADDGKNMVIRPLVYVSEGEIKAYVKKMGFPVICCQCPIMCGETVHGDYKRRMVKKMIDQLEPVIPNLRNSLISALGNVQPSHLLDTSLWDFTMTPKAKSESETRAEFGGTELETQT